jgi:DNA-binding response OmpR family regulator
MRESKETSSRKPITESRSMLKGRLRKPHPGQKQEPLADKGGHDITLNILLVEDEPLTAASTARLLRMEGFEVQVVSDGPCAFHAAQDNPPDVILLDIGLPGMNGWQVAQHFWEQTATRRPFIIAISGYGKPADVMRSQEAGIYMHLVKPVDAEYLVRVLRRFKAVLAP